MIAAKFTRQRVPADANVQQARLGAYNIVYLKKHSNTILKTISD